MAGMADYIGMTEAGELLGGISGQGARALLRRRGVPLENLAGRALVVERLAVLVLLEGLEHERAELAELGRRSRGGVPRAVGGRFGRRAGSAASGGAAELGGGAGAGDRAGGAVCP